VSAVALAGASVIVVVFTTAKWVHTWTDLCIARWQVERLTEERDQLRSLVARSVTRSPSMIWDTEPRGEA
jgi:hypothetical protein